MMKTLERLFKKLKRFRGRVKLVLIDGYQDYEKFITKYLSVKGRKPITGVINKSRFNHKTGNSTPMVCLVLAVKRLIRLFRRWV